MSAERLREMLREATLPWKINWYENGGVESIDLGESDFISTDGTFYGPNPQNAALIALAPDAIALLADLVNAVEEQRRVGPVWPEIDAVLARLDALCGDDRV